VTTEHTSELVQFRQSLYQNLNNRADTVMELIDALCSSPAAQSPVELTLASSFRRTYSTMYKAIDEFMWEEGQLAQLLAPSLPRPRRRGFWLLGVDVTPQPRPFAPTLTDRGMVYQPTVVKRNRPVTIGHQYSTVALLPEPEANLSDSWVVPLMTGRVATTDDKELVGAAQIAGLLKDHQLPFHDSLCVEVGDTSYSKPAYLHANRHHPNLVTIARARGTRTFYRQVGDEAPANSRGHPTWFGDAFSLRGRTMWHAPDETSRLTEISRRGKCYRVEIQAWHNMLMRGKRVPRRLPMHRYPFTLLRIVRYDEQGQQVSERPLWLIVIGPRRHELGLAEIYQAYGQRYDLEIVCTQMTKGRMLALRAGGNGIADFDVPVIHDHSIHEQLDQLPALGEGQLWQSRLNALAEIIDTRGYGGQINLALGLGVQLAQLMVQTITSTRQLLPFPFELVTGNDLGEIGFQQARLLTCQLGQRLAYSTSA
jgi:hypothetical protein